LNSFTTFELRSKPDPTNVNNSSGSLDLQEDFGLAAITDCGLYDRFSEIKSQCTEQTKIWDKNGNVLMDDEGEGRLEISRNVLTDLLLSRVPTERIQWNTKVATVLPATGSEKGLVEFIKGDSIRSEAFDLIVGADGAWSRARASIQGAARPVYSGVIRITLDVPPLSETRQDLDTLLS
jgi:2-polyprenyl-6-methoxyphenol hydroxylase-like FAD-dependent oxidoreductase